MQRGRFTEQLRRLAEFRFGKERTPERPFTEDVTLVESRGARLALDLQRGEMACACAFLCQAASERCEFDGVKVTTPDGETTEFLGYDPEVYYGDRRDEKDCYCNNPDRNMIRCPIGSTVSVEFRGATTAVDILPPH